MGSEALIIASDLCAEMLFLYLQKGLRILAFHPRDEETEETTEKIADAFDHNWDLSKRITVPPRLASLERSTAF
jgi:hypothetical protein